MKVKHLKELLNTYDEDKEILLKAENGELLNPKIRFILKDKYDVLNLSKENIETLVLTW